MDVAQYRLFVGSESGEIHETRMYEKPESSITARISKSGDAQACSSFIGHRYGYSVQSKGKNTRNFNPSAPANQIFSRLLIFDAKANDPVSPVTPFLPLFASFASSAIHRQKVTCLAVTLHARTLVSASSDGTLRLWDIGSKLCIRTIDLKGMFVF